MSPKIFHKTILSLFDYTGSWSEPYKKAGYHVIMADIKHSIDIFEVMEDVLSPDNADCTVYGILAAPPCTDFSVSGAWKWKDKENQPAEYYSDCTNLIFTNTVEHSIAMVIATLEIIERLKPSGFWVLENPIGRINQLVPELQPYGPWYFDPYEFGDPYTKKTGLWGRFNKPVKTPVLPLFGSMMIKKYGGKSEHTKTLRSATPKGFAKAFFLSNQ